MLRTTARAVASRPPRVGLRCALLLTLLFAACGPSETNEYNAAQTSGDPAAYESFIAKFPDSSLVPSAKERMDDARFLKAQQAASIEAWQEYLTKHPDGKHAPDAKYQLEQLTYKAAEQANTREAWEKFLKDFPSGTFTAAAQKKLDELSAGGATGDAAAAAPPAEGAVAEKPADAKAP